MSSATGWLEVSLRVDGELAEAVADVFARFAPEGVVMEQGVDFSESGAEGRPSGVVTVRVYLLIDAHVNEKRRKLEEALYFLGVIQPLPAPTFNEIHEQDWMEAWKAHYEPIPIGKRLIIVPTRMESPEFTRVSVKIDPGMAFGTGTHPTTRLCLELIEDFMSQNISPGNPAGTPDVIDIGCGSGILAIAALKLGASRALAVDTDEAALKAARGNALANGIGEELVLGLGSVAEILADKLPGFPQSGQAIRHSPLVFANILAPVIVRLFGDGLADLVTFGGSLILSGILDGQAGEVMDAASAKGMNLVQQRQMGEWTALVMSHTVQGERCLK